MDKSMMGVCLLIYERERNQAIGIKQDPQLLRGLSAFVRSVGKEETKVHIKTMATATYLKAMIEEYTALAYRLDDYVTTNIEDEEIRRNGLEAMVKLESYITHLGDELGQML